MAGMKEMSPLEEIRHSCCSCARSRGSSACTQIPSLDIGPPTDSGFYYDFDSDIPFTPEIIEEIEAEMKKVIKENQRFERLEVSRRRSGFDYQKYGAGDL